MVLRQVNNRIYVFLFYNPKLLLQTYVLFKKI